MIDSLLGIITTMPFLFISYTILGAGIKYIDAAYDEHTFDKRIALLFAPLLGLFWSFTMLLHPVSATILLAVALSVLLKGKIDNRAFLIGFAVIAGVLLFMGMHVAVLPLVFLTTAGVLDELGNDVIDYNKKDWKESVFRHQFSKYFFGRRYFMKAAVLVLVIMGVLPVVYLIAFILFDEAYIVVGMYSETKRKKTA